MSVAPATLVALGQYWKAKNGILLGIVGNTAHTKGYHLGKDRIYDGTGPGVGDADYSVQLARDKAGLTNAAAAIDLGRLNGSYGQLRKFSRWLVEQCIRKAPGYEDVREVIYSPDGTLVIRWSGEDRKFHVGPGNGDSSHRTHTHISYYRDSQKRDKLALFVPYFAPAVPCPPDTTPFDQADIDAAIAVDRGKARIVWE